MASSNVHELTDLNFESVVTGSSGPVLVDFTAAWCPPCRALSPIVARIAEEASGRVLVASVDVDACPNLAATFRIRGMPTLVVLRNGKEVARHMGLTDEKGVRDLLDSAVAPVRPAVA